MTQEEKAKAYDEVRKKIAIRFGSNVVEEIFSKFEMSDDERIRKKLIEAVKGDMVVGGTKDKQLALAWLEKQGTDKVKPKFKVGDWVVFDNKHESVYQVERIDNYRYYLRHYLGGALSVHFDNELIRQWTIHDAKDGDVLACESGWTCIFKTLVNDETFSSYCFMDNTKWFCETGSESHTLNKVFMKAYHGNIYPATKEQRALLFQKMHEAGYEWDAEKKELNKIEQNPAWSEEDENMLDIILTDISYAQKNYSNSKLIPYSRKVDWLKSLRPQKQWKPSDEQMTQLKKYCPDNRPLTSLYEQLKKLKDE